MLAEPTERFLRDLATASDLHAASSLLAQFSRSLPAPRAGFDYDIANPGLPGNGDSEPLGVELGWPSEFVRRWVKGGMVLACPLAIPCRKRWRPFTWSMDEDNLGLDGDELPRPFTAMGQQALSLLRQAGVRSGILVPVHQPGGRTGFVSWVSDRPHAEMRRWADDYASELFVVAHAFLERVDAMLNADAAAREDCPLTERERECLTWVARGKTDSEIGIIIDRSPETARFHVRNAIAKLDASSRSHAVAKAMRRGWLGAIE
ncbi:MAG: autoinducer binding domain-containing protein [Rhodothalassiaceae bacterium]